MNDILDTQWTRASIFYDKLCWNQLVSEGILPFVNNPNYKKLIETFYIHFGSNPIYHVKLTFKSTVADKSKLENKFLEWMDEFLLNNPSETQESGYRFYSNNNVWVDQYDDKEFYLNKTFDQNLDALRSQISQTIIALCNDVIDDESLFTLVLYLQLGVIKASHPNLQDASNTLKNLIEYLNQPEVIKRNLLQIGNKTILNKLFRNNDELLLSIIRDIWSDNYGDELVWLQNWIKACKSLKNIDFNLSFLLITRIICEHLGLNSRKLLRLNVKLLIISFSQLKNVY